MLTKNKGYYTIYSVDKDNKETLLHNTNNIVPVGGLDLICTKNTSTILDKCVVSTDSSDVFPTTNQIPSIVASTTKVISEPEFGAQDTEPYYFWYRKTFEFAEGQANGNLAKIAITDSSDKIFSVALFKDALGANTTIQPIANERLRIVYEYRCYMDTEDIVLKNLTLIRNDPTLYTLTLRPAYINSSSVASHLDRGLSIIDGARPILAFKGPIGTIRTSPSQFLFKKDGLNFKPYVSESLVKHFEISFGYDEFNTEEGIASLLFSTSRGCYQIGISPPLKKNSTQLMKISFPLKMES